MFEIGFWELVLILVIALLVLGPERLPEVARTVGRWVGKARSMMRNVKAEIDRELAADELQRILSKQAESQDPFEIIEKAAAPAPPPANHEPAATPPAASAAETAHDQKPDGYKNQDQPSGSDESH